MKWLFLDNEGPCTLNDNAQESTVALAELCGLGKQVGIDFYQRLSVIDDIWGDFHKITKDPDYSSGHTLKVILPFLKAMGADSEWLYRFARENLRIVPNIGTVIKELQQKFIVTQVSTSYNFFIRAFCDLVGFDFSNTHCTWVNNIDQVPLTNDEAIFLRRFMYEVAKMPIIQYDSKTGEVILEYQKYYQYITKFVWETLWNMPVGQLLRTVFPIGQEQKRKVIEDMHFNCKSPNCEFVVTKDEMMYIGDSQTDKQAVQSLHGKGLTMMFNGKGRVCELSDIMYIGEDARAIQEVAERFADLGREDVLSYYSPPREASFGGLIATVTPENLERLHEMSVKKRKEFRGVHIGELT